MARDGAMTSLQELRRALLVKLGEQLKPLGFKLRISEEEYYRDVPVGRQYLYVSFRNYKDHLDVSLYVRMQLKALEQLCEAINNARSDPIPGGFTSFGSNIVNLADD